jgi:hypothetical protein
MRKGMNNKGAIELSIGTIVVIVLAMSMLILGLILVKNIFTGATYNVDQMNSKVQDEIKKLFVDENTKSVVYLSNRLAQIKQNAQWGVAFAYKNTLKGSTTVPKFRYEIALDDSSLRSTCPGIGVKEVESWIKTGQSSSPVPLPAGETKPGLVRFSIPEGAPLCVFRFNIIIYADNQAYTSDFFDVEVLSK